MKHLQLIKIGQALGYGSIENEGICNGFSSMWLQAACAGDLATFNIRLGLLNKYKDNPGRLPTDIQAVKR